MYTTLPLYSSSWAGMGWHRGNRPTPATMVCRPEPGYFRCTEYVYTIRGYFRKYLIHG